MKELRIGVGEEETKRLFSMFDINHDGSISYNEFLKIVMGDMNETRRQVVEAAFKKLDKNGDNVITLDEVKDLYSASRHPDVMAKRKTEGEILEEFLETFEQHYDILVCIVGVILDSTRERRTGR